MQKLNGVFENDHKTFCYTFLLAIIKKVHEKEISWNGALSKNRGRPFRHVAKFVQEK